MQPLHRHHMAIYKLHENILELVYKHSQHKFVKSNDSKGVFCHYTMQHMLLTISQFVHLADKLMKNQPMLAHVHACTCAQTHKSKVKAFMFIFHLVKWSHGTCTPSRYSRISAEQILLGALVPHGRAAYASWKTMWTTKIPPEP